MVTRRQTIAATCAAAALIGGLPLTLAPAVHAAPPRCPDLFVVAIPGTWETSVTEPGRGMLAAVVDDLPGDVAVEFVHYPATAFPWEGEVYGRSKNEAFVKARQAVAAVAQSCDATRFALLGYSQGADAAGDLAAEIGTGLGVVAPHRVELVGLIADPRRSPTDNLIGPPVPGAGAVGPRIGGFGRLSRTTYTFCAPGDLYCAMPDGDFAGRIAGFVVQLSNPDPAKIDSYQRQADQLITDALAAGGLGLLADQLNAAAYEERRRQVNDFLESGVHQSYPHYRVGRDETTALSWLRRRLLEVIRR
ncbi:cutinase family protein [Nocardia farcinica]|uniref:cutinase family protein n=1 Tax=Nocardia farcinica TaxID=37329 RepID=UPI001B3C5645|nr:cutinase family protein [Nocardia farcinica]MBF6537231.1 cutinase family protein [Nocardia farcinica]